MIPSRLQSSGAFVLRKFKSLTAACPLIGSAQSGGAITRPSLLVTSLVFACILLLPMLMIGGLALAVHGIGLPHADAHLTLAPLALSGVLGATTERPMSIKREEADLRALLRELEIGQTEMAAGPISQARGEELEGKAKEAEAKQKRIDQYNRLAGVVEIGKELPSVTLPTDARGRMKSVKTTAGHLFIASDAFAQFRKEGKHGQSAWIEVASRLGRPVTLKGQAAVEFETKAFSDAQLSDLGSDAIIQVDRDPEIVRFEEPEILTIRDVLRVTTTSSDSVRYVKHTATDRAADVQATRGAAKSYLVITAEAVDVNTSTIAVLAKVTEQDIDDAPRLVDIINGEMSLDVRVKEEDQLLWGTGNNGQVKGLFSEDIPQFDRAVADDTVIDVIRKMRTDLRKRRVTPTFVAIDPIDWESVELAKGSDDRYVWGMITDLRGPRIWSLRVVESDAMTHASSGHRRILVGDGVRGATIYDRHDVRLNIGFVNDDFERNLRTLRAEERLALGVKRPWAFEYAVTSGPAGAES